MMFAGELQRDFPQDGSWIRKKDESQVRMGKVNELGHSRLIEKLLSGFNFRSFGLVHIEKRTDY